MSGSVQTVVVNGVSVPIEGEKNLLEVIRKAGFDVPTLCYHTELSVYGGCRQCIVETDKGQILAACSTPPADGLQIRTHTPRVRKIRRMALELTLANHDLSCTTCGKSGACDLQRLAHEYGIDSVRFPQRSVAQERDLSAAGVVYDRSKCILCGACVRVCREVQGVAAVDFAYRGAKMVVSPAFGEGLGETVCVQCGQCVSVCPTGALMIHSDIDKAWEALEDPNLMVIVQIAPAVRVSLGEAFGLPPGTAVLGKLVTALRLMGVDRVFDTVFAADLTIMEETTEFIGRLKEGRNLPLFTSCCPGWVKYVEHQAPELIPHLSTCRSPQQMFGSVIKRDYARRLGKEPEDVCVISIMPCTAKKFEAARPEFTTDGVPDVDLVLTTQEMAQMIHQSGLRFEELPEGKLDSPFGVTTGSGTVFGATGGVTEAVLRTAHWMLTGEDAEKVDIEEVRGEGRVRTLRTQIDGTEVKVAVAHTLAAARDIIRSVEAGEATYDIIEVMACPGGCVGGGGQPYIKGMKERYRRAEGLYRADRSSPVRRSYENPDVQEVYRQWLGEPNSALAHTYLHTSYTDRSVRHMEPTLVE